jgi:hypothetical protein
MGNTPGNCKGCGNKQEFGWEGDHSVENPMLTLGNGGNSLKSLHEEDGSKAVIENSKLL